MGGYVFETFPSFGRLQGAMAEVALVATCQAIAALFVMMGWGAQSLGDLIGAATGAKSSSGVASKKMAFRS